MITIEEAIRLACSRHAGQVDKAGEPYIFHVLRVMLSVKGFERQLAAIAHDLVEDTATTLEELSQLGFPASVVAAIEALTKKEGETRMQAAKRASKDPIARDVKLEDNQDNSNLGRLKEVTERDMVRLREYQAVREILLEAQAAETNIGRESES